MADENNDRDDDKPGDNIFRPLPPEGVLRPGAAVVVAIGWLMLLVAIAALSYEVMQFGRTGSYRVIASGELWFMLDVGSLNLAQAVTQRYIHPYLWDPIIAGLLHWPAWSLFGAPGVVLAFGIRMRRPA